jgi:hypothetical protein
LHYYNFQITFGFPPTAKQIPQIIELFPEVISFELELTIPHPLPVPFGPITTFKNGPGLQTTLSYVLKLDYFLY